MGNKKTVAAFPGLELMPHIILNQVICSSLKNWTWQILLSFYTKRFDRPCIVHTETTHSMYFMTKCKQTPLTNQPSKQSFVWSATNQLLISWLLSLSLWVNSLWSIDQLPESAVEHLTFLDLSYQPTNGILHYRTYMLHITMATSWSQQKIFTTKFIIQRQSNMIKNLSGDFLCLSEENHIIGRHSRPNNSSGVGRVKNRWMFSWLFFLCGKRDRINTCFNFNTWACINQNKHL